LTQVANDDCSNRFPRRYRIRKRREYLSLQKGGRRRRSEHFTVISRETGGPARLGITTSRKVGNAPARNRVRRLVREFFRQHRGQITPPRDVLVIASPGARDLQYRAVERELSRSLEI